MIRFFLILFITLEGFFLNAQQKISLFFVEKDQHLLNSVNDFQNIFEKSIGYRPLLKRVVSSNQILIETSSSHVKKNELTKLGDDGFIIRSLEGNRLLITGNTEIGTEYGIYYFLEKYLGVKWLFPGEKWESIPSNKRFTLPVSNELVFPDFKTRWLAPINSSQKNELGKWGRHLKLRKDVEYNHNMFRIFEGTNDFLPTVKGKKIYPKSKADQSWQPNFTANGASKYANNYLRNFFKQNPTVKSFSLSINDSQVFDDAIVSSEINHQGLKDYSFHYYKWVKETVEETNKSFPNKTYGVLAYNNVILPPKFSLPQNIVPFITYERLRWIDPKLKEKDIGVLKQWRSKVNEIGWYDYTYGLNYIIPRPYFTTMAEYLRYGYNNNVAHYTTELYTNILEGPKAWIISQLLWDTSLNPDNLLDEWCIAAVGRESSIHLKNFYKLWENFWVKKVVDSKWWALGGTAYLHFNNLSYIDLIPVEYMDKSDELLTNALSSTKDGIEKVRIQEIIKVWELSKLNYVYYTKRNLKTLDFRKVTRDIILNKLEEVNKTPLNGSLVHYSKRFNKY